MGTEGHSHWRGKGPKHLPTWWAVGSIDDSWTLNTADEWWREQEKKTIALKATTSALSEEDSEKSKNEEVKDDDLPLLTHKFKKFLKRKSLSIRGKNFYRKPLDRVREKENEKDERKEKSNICYECNRSRHLGLNVP